MRSSPLFLTESAVGRSHYTHLFACISEEEDNVGFTVQVRLYNNLKRDNTVWGEEIANCFETASMLVAALAAEFSIAPERVELEIRMHKFSDSTRH
jgi:hypothetical protein